MMLENLLIVSLLLGFTLVPITLAILYFRSENRQKKYHPMSRNNPNHWGWQIVELFTSRE